MRIEIQCQIECRTRSSCSACQLRPVRSLAGYSQDKAYQRNENRNRSTNRMSYRVKFVNWPIQSGTEVRWLLSRESLSKSGERRLESLLNKNPHTEHAWASCDSKAVSRSFPYGSHLPLPQNSTDIVSVRDLQKKRKETTSANHHKM